MALRSLFRRFSLSALSKRWMKRFGTSLRKRFLRQQYVLRRNMRMEPLEERSLLTALHLVGTASNAWSNPNNWVETTTPMSGDTLVFDTTNAGAVNFYTPNNDISSLTNLNITVT